MKLSFVGMRANATREDAASAFGDILLAILKGDESIEDAKDFLFHGKDDEYIKSVPYDGGFVTID